MVFEARIPAMEKMAEFEVRLACGDWEEVSFCIAGIRIKGEKI